jgi:hypothetical protein
MINRTSRKIVAALIAIKGSKIKVKGTKYKWYRK